MTYKGSMASKLKATLLYVPNNGLFYAKDDAKIKAVFDMSKEDFNKRNLKWVDVDLTNPSTIFKAIG